MIHMIKSLSSLVMGVLFVVFCGGCATPPRAQAMTTSECGHSLLHGTIGHVSVSGGKSTNPLWCSEIGDPEFVEALRQSLQNACILAMAPNVATCELEAVLLSTNTPIMGFDFTINASVSYTIFNRPNRNVAYHKVISSSHTATVSDAFVAIDRLRIAQEGCMRKNIQSFIRDVSQTIESKHHTSLTVNQ